LPIALVFAWVYEITPQGLRRQRARGPLRHRARHHRHRHRRRRRHGNTPDSRRRLIPEHAVPPASGAAALAAVEARSIAVPLADMSQEKDQEYFADGLSGTDEPARASNLRVIGRTSAFQFKGRRGLADDRPWASHTS
jgi:hypothetical protein